MEMVRHAGLDPVLAGRELITESRNVVLAFCQDGLRAGRICAVAPDVESNAFGC